MGGWRAGEVFAAGDGGLVGDLASVELPLPLDGLTQRCYYSRRPGLLGRFGLLRFASCSGARGRSERHELVGRYMTREPVDVTFLEGGFRAEGDLDGLLYITVFGGCCLATHADDARENLWLCLADSAWKVDAFGEAILLSKC